MTFNFPRWLWIIIVIVIIIVVCVLLKFNLVGHIGSEGIGVNATQGVVH